MSSPTTTPPTIGVAGITGSLGSKVVQSLLAHPSQPTVRGLCRSASKLAPPLLSHPHLTVTEGSSSDLAAARTAVRGCSVVICCYSGSNELMLEGQKVLIDACVAEKVDRYVVSDFTLDYTRLRPTDIPSKEPMFRVSEYLDGKPIRGVHVFIGAFVETWWTFLGIFRPEEYALRYWGEGGEMWEMTTYDDTARFVAEVALDSSAEGVLKCE